MELDPEFGFDSQQRNLAHHLACTVVQRMEMKGLIFMFYVVTFGQKATRSSEGVSL